MKKRLMVGLLAGGLLAAMLPGFASANDRVEVCHISTNLQAARTLMVPAAAVPALLATGHFTTDACVIIPL
jgi:hypothetical protein